MSDEKKVVIPVSIGEIVDKITILEIKLRHVRSEVMRSNIEREHCLLKQTLADLSIEGDAELNAAAKDLQDVNLKLWTIEDHLREREREQDFGEEFVQLARSVYMLNDQRASIKRKINVASGSVIVEEKLYAEYGAK